VEPIPIQSKVPVLVVVVVAGLLRMLVHSTCMVFRLSAVRMSLLTKLPPSLFWFAAMAVMLMSIKANAEKRRISLAIVFSM